MADIPVITTDSTVIITFPYSTPISVAVADASLQGQVQSDWNSTSGVSSILNKPTQLSYWVEDTTHRVATDAEKAIWNGKQDALGYIPVQSNTGITGDTSTKITFDSKGLITSGTNATQDDIGDGTTYKQYSNTDKTKLAGIANGANVNVSSDWNAISGDAQILNKPTQLSYWADDITHRTVTDTEKGTWNGKVDSNTLITGATKTKITYDLKGLVTSGSDISSSDISDFATTVRSTVLTGLSLLTNAAITATDTILTALGKIQAHLTSIDSLMGGITTKASNYTTGITDKTILCDATSGGFSITLIAAASFIGYPLNIKKIDSTSNVISIIGTVDGSTSLVINSPMDSVTLVSDGVSWYII